MTMGLQEKPQVSDEAQDRILWVVSGIPVRAPLTPVITTRSEAGDEEEHKGSMPTTPREKEAKIPKRLLCPPPPKKQKVKLSCNLDGIQFFSAPEDLKTVFIRRRLETAS